MKEGSGGVRTVAVGQHHVTISRLNAVVTSPPLAKVVVAEQAGIGICCRSVNLCLMTGVMLNLIIDH